MPAKKPILIPLLAVVPAAAVLLFFALVPALPGSPPEGPAKGEKEVRLLFAGDILLSRGVENVLSRSSQSIVAALNTVVSGADWAAGNLEGAVGAPGDCVGVPPASFPDKVPCFAVRGDYVPLLRQMGFKAIGMENNHAMDLGPTGRKAGLDALIANGLTPLTRESSPWFVRFDDITVGVVAFTMVSGRGDGPGGPDLVDLRRRMRLARNLAQYVIVYVHWGSEFLDWPDERQRKMARWLVKNGADVIVGHHPHVIQKPEILDGKPVFYSLGNLLFDQRYPATKEGLLAELLISGDTARCAAIKTHTDANSVFPSIGHTDAESERVLSGCVLKAGRPLTVSGTVLRPRRDRAADGSPGLVLEAEAEGRGGRVLWKSQPAVIVSVEKMKAAGPKGEGRREDYLFSLEEHYSPLDEETGLRPCVYEAHPDGLTSKWRGTALAWPLKDAAFLPGEEGVLCALHRGDSFLMPQPASSNERIAAYRWNGFGFSGIDDPRITASCEDVFR
jgi:poly-gamma-glutamate synthesis protein (capsule biosynthesis protein)